MSPCDAIAADIEVLEELLASKQAELPQAPNKALALAEILRLTQQIWQKRADLAACLRQQPGYETDVMIIDLAQTAGVVLPGEGVIWKLSDAGRFPLGRRAVQDTRLKFSQPASIPGFQMGVQRAGQPER